MSKNEKSLLTHCKDDNTEFVLENYAKLCNVQHQQEA